MRDKRHSRSRFICVKRGECSSETVASLLPASCSAEDMRMLSMIVSLAFYAALRFIGDAEETYVTFSTSLLSQAEKPLPITIPRLMHV